MLRKLLAGLAMATLGACLGAPQAGADDVADFYASHGIRIVAAAGAGGGFGIRAQLLAEFLPRHMPGHPTVHADFMPGAGGRKAAAYIYDVAPKDGTEFGILFHNMASVALIRPEGTRYDPSKFNYLGSQAPAMITIYVWHEAPATTLEGMRKRELIFASQAKTSSGAMAAMADNVIVGTKFRLVLGYRGTSDYLKALEHGEAHAALADWDSIVSVRPEWVKEGMVIPVIQHTLYRHPALPDVPRLIDLAKTDLHRKIAEFDALASAIGHTNVAPPGVPRDRVEALRTAIAATYRDPAFIEKSASLKMAVKPVSAEDVEKYVRQIMSYPPEFIAEVQKVYGLR